MRRFLSLFALAALFPIGCGSQLSTTKTGDGEKQAPDPWPNAVVALRREADPATCRRVLGQLGNDLSLNRNAAQPTALSPDAEKAIREAIPLPEPDIAELRSPVFTPLDGAYLGDCYYLRDATRTLETPSKPLALSEAAFDWVCRQVELRPWVMGIPNGLISPTLPPTAVLRRGSGSGLERAYVFLAVLQQLGLDGCLIGGPDATSQSGSPVFPQKSPEVPKGPFWAVGVRIGAEIYLFDPWHHSAIPGPSGNGIATLAQVIADPALAKITGVPPEQVKSAIPYLVAPLSSLTPRIKLLEDKLKDEAPVRLAIDPLALRTRFHTEAKQPNATFWNPLNDPFTYTHGLPVFLPADEGGRDASPEGQRLYDRYRAEMLPRSALFVLPKTLVSSDARSRLAQLFAGSYMNAFFVAPTPRESIQRGFFTKATESLVKDRTTFAAGKERLRTDKNREAEAQQWVQRANDLYEQLGRARLDEKTNPVGVSQAQAAIDEFWKTPHHGIGALVDDAVSEPGVAEATYQLAICKHEVAEQMQSRYEAAVAAVEAAPNKGKAPSERGREQARERAKNAWTEAKNWWGYYERYAPEQERSYLGRTAHAQRLSAEANTALERLGR